MISIAGLGVAGAYLMRRLGNEGMEVAGFDPKVDGFYVPCGYATNRNIMDGLLANVGLSVDSYIEKTADQVVFESEGGKVLRLRGKGLCTIDKNMMERDLLGEINFSRKKAEMPPSREDILIDATGVSRYYLGPSPRDFLMFTKEYLASTSRHGEFYFRYFSSGRGYYWEFPMNNGYHVGAGGDSADLVRNSLNWVSNPLKVVSRKIRLSPLFDDMFKGNIIGVGEAIGTVSPITGEGILPSMESAEILFRQLAKHDDVETIKANYSAEIRKKFSRFTKLYGLLIDARNGELRKLSNLSAVRSAKEDFENFGIEMKIGKVLRQLAFT